VRRLGDILIMMMIAATVVAAVWLWMAALSQR
jgi:hypothetical protein